MRRKEDLATETAACGAGVPPASVAAAQPETLNPEPATAPKARKPRTRKKPPKPEALNPEPTTAAQPPGRDKIHTVDERLEVLPALDSLKKLAPSEGDSPQPVDATAPPPPAPPPPVEPAPTSFVDRGAPIPEHYDLDRLVALPRDPNWLYVYWELKGGALERLRFQLSAEIIDNSRWVLRVATVHELASGGHGASTQGGPYLVDVDLRVGNWYLKVAPDTRFILELGFINPQGDFVCLLKANEVCTPRTGASNIVDERWMIVRDDLEKLVRAGGGIAPFATPAAGGVARSEQPRAIGFFSSYLAHVERKTDT